MRVSRRFALCRAAAARLGGCRRLFQRDEVRYEPTPDCDVCPTGERLTPYSRSNKDEHVSIRYTNVRACKTGALRSHCTSGARRTIDRRENKAALDRMAERLAAEPEILA
ncbi:hypothetical protein GCM10016234_30420 [Tianweitania populi]|uniref:Transposase n=1 Tax=Tianweitania populi TaxID=1607949 RepID=A0A8J3GLT0_9HYPH|nr:hypothetical protein GCM10016234_30420 [Tianweitania populi]